MIRRDEHNFGQVNSHHYPSTLPLSLPILLLEYRLMASVEASVSKETNTTMISNGVVSPFEESQISSTVTADNAPTFFREHGIFYKADADIGRQAKALLYDKEMRKALLMKDPASMTGRDLRVIVNPF